MILAAGQGSRMASDLPKVLHEVAGKALIAHVLKAVASAEPAVDPIVVVLGHQATRVAATIPAPIQSVVQEPQRGTADAVRQASGLLKGLVDTVLVVYGDVPLIRSHTLSTLLKLHLESHAAATLLTMHPADPGAYGRIIRGEGGLVVRIVEAVGATESELAVAEVNSGVGVWDAEWLWEALDRLPPAPSGEFYLTDLVAQAVAEGRRVAAVGAPDPAEAQGVNSRADLAAAEGALRARIREKHMAAGVTLVSPADVWIDAEVTLGRDTVVWPQTFLLGSTTVGAGATLGPGTLLRDARVGDGARVEWSVVEGADVGTGCSVGPFAHLREGTQLEAGSRVGNFAEIKRSRLGKGAKASHFSYVGDADVGDGVNIGAGTVTANYDGKAKHRTVIGAGAFIGSGTMLVAPVTVGAAARTGAGSVVTRDVAPGDTVVGVPAKPRKAGSAP